MDVPRLAAQFQRVAGVDAMLLVAPYLSPRTRELLAAAGLSYLDATGSVRLALDHPSILIELNGATTDPWRSERAQPIASLKGPVAGRVVRALCDFRPPYGVLALAAKSRTTPSSVSRVVNFLEREAFVRREGRGRIVEVGWAGLVQRWSEDYSFTRANRVRTFLEPRGLPALLDKLRSSELHYAVTGSFAATELAPVAAARAVTIYLDQAAPASDQLGLLPAERGANVLVAQPFDPVVFDRTWTRGDLVYAAPSQVVADLLTGPGRAPAEGAALIQWMQRHESDWRT